MKSILVHVQSDEGLTDRLEAAMSVARSCGGHVSCLHVTPAEAYVAFDAFGGVFVMADVMKALDEQEAELRQRVDQEFSNEDVSWDYEQVTGPVVATLVSRAALNDALVIGRRQNPSIATGEPLAMIGDLLHRTRTPLLIPGSGKSAYDAAGPVLIGWDGSYEAANAVRGTLGLMQSAAEVKVLRVEEEEGSLFPSTRLLEYLSRHDVHAELIVEQAEKELTAPALISHAGRLGAQTLVIGGYSHSRIGEYLFGGVTRSLLQDCPIALVVAH